MLINKSSCLYKILLINILFSGKQRAEQNIPLFRLVHCTHIYTIYRESSWYQRAWWRPRVHEGLGPLILCKTCKKSSTVLLRITKLYWKWLKSPKCLMMQMTKILNIGNVRVALGAYTKENVIYSANLTLTYSSDRELSSTEVTIIMPRMIITLN